MVGPGGDKAQATETPPPPPGKTPPEMGRPVGTGGAHGHSPNLSANDSARGSDNCPHRVPLKPQNLKAPACPCPRPCPSSLSLYPSATSDLLCKTLSSPPVVPPFSSLLSQTNLRGQKGNNNWAAFLGPTTDLATSLLRAETCFSIEMHTDRVIKITVGQTLFFNCSKYRIISDQKGGRGRG